MAITILLLENKKQFKNTPPRFRRLDDRRRRTRARTGPARLTVTAECRLGARDRVTRTVIETTKRGLTAAASAAAAGKRIGASRPA